MFRRSAGSLVCALLALLAATTAASAARAPRIWFPSNRLPLAHATRLGAASPSQRMELGVGLKDPHPAAEQSLMAAQQNNARGLEYPWPYTGGGQSFFIPAPSYQSGVSGLNRPCLSDVNGNRNTGGVTCRGIPDVADESGDIATSSYDIYSDELGGASGEGGTSLSSPLMVGMWARVQAAARGGTGFANPLIYAVGNNATQDAADFNDYEVGTNGAYQALPGWDYVSGWGTPNLTPLMKDVDHGNTAPIQTG